MIPGSTSPRATVSTAATGSGGTLPRSPSGYIRDYIVRLRRGEAIDRRLAELAAERERITGEYTALLDSPARADFEAKLGLARQVYPYVENHNFYIEHWTMSVFWRKARELSALLHRAGFWPGANDMFYLGHGEVRGRAVRPRDRVGDRRASRLAPVTGHRRWNGDAGSWTRSHGPHPEPALNEPPRDHHRAVLRHAVGHHQRADPVVAGCPGRAGAT